MTPEAAIAVVQADEIWIEVIRPGRPPSLLAGFRIGDAPVGSFVEPGVEFQVELDGIGQVVLSPLACVKGLSVYEAIRPGQGLAQDLLQVPVLRLCSKL